MVLLVPSRYFHTAPTPRKYSHLNNILIDKYIKHAETVLYQTDKGDKYTFNPSPYYVTK